MNCVFGYGSLMWRPGFPVSERCRATLHGFHRAFCRYSWNHRGTREAPGLVAGLMPGGHCVGYALRFDDDTAADVLAYLDDREGAGYVRLCLPLQAEGPGGTFRQSAWVYVPNPNHPSSAPDMPRDEIVRMVATARGQSGTSYDYLVSLLGELDTLGIEEPFFREILEEVERYRAARQLDRSAASM